MTNLFRAAITAAAITSTAAAAFADPVSIPEKLIEDLQTDLEITDFQAAGIVGNLARETGNFRFLYEMNPLIEGSRGGIGYGQWTGPRHDAFLAHVGERNPMDYAVNYEFLLQELEGPYADVLARLYEARDAREASVLIMKEYLAPHPKYRYLEERVAHAEAYLSGNFEDAGCASVHRVYKVGLHPALQECPTPISEIRPRPRPETLEVVQGDLEPGKITELLEGDLQVRNPFGNSSKDMSDPVWN